MESRTFTAEDLRQEEQAAEALLRDLPQAREESGGLKLTGLEFLAFLGIKVVLPIACGFVSRLLYEKYKGMQVESQANQAREELTGKTAGEDNAVNRTTVIEELTTELVKDGINEDGARKVVTATYERMEKLYCS